MKTIKCSFCPSEIKDGETMALVKIPHRAVQSSCLRCAKELKELSRERTTYTEKINKGGIVSDFDMPS